MDLRLFLTVLFIGVVYAGEGAQWGYTGAGAPEHWAETAPLCGGETQSPIDIKERDTTLDDTLDNIFLVVQKETGGGYLVNNGHSVALMLDDVVTISGGGLGDTYRTIGPHWHWGSDSSKGSEHLINGKAFPIEMHFVSYDTEKYGTVVDAVTSGEESALAVLGVMFEVQAKNNTALEPITSKLSEAVHPDKDKKVPVTGVEVLNMLPSDTQNFYRYQGSLTTPTCNPVVRWTVFSTPVGISEYQLNLFRSLHESHSEDGTPHMMVNNYRPVQPLNGRGVTRSFQRIEVDMPKDPPKSKPASSGDSAANTATVSFFTLSIAMVLSYLHM